VQPLAPDASGAIVYSDGFHLNIVDHSEVTEVLQAPQGSELYTPTWSPDGSRIAYLAPGSSGEKSLWVQEATRDAEPVEFQIEGAPGPPAWGAR